MCLHNCRYRNCDMAANFTFDPQKQLEENEAYNWKCISCHVIAWSPVKLQSQQILNRSVVYTDVSGEKWIKCAKCLCPSHLSCAGESEEDLKNCTKYLCKFLNCEEEEFFYHFCYKTSKVQRK